MSINLPRESMKHVPMQFKLLASVLMGFSLVAQIQATAPQHSELSHPVYEGAINWNKLLSLTAHGDVDSLGYSGECNIAFYKFLLRLQIDGIDYDQYIQNMFFGKTFKPEKDMRFGWSVVNVQNEDCDIYIQVKNDGNVFPFKKYLDRKLHDEINGRMPISIVLTIHEFCFNLPNSIDQWILWSRDPMSIETADEIVRQLNPDKPYLIIAPKTRPKGLKKTTMFYVFIDEN